MQHVTFESETAYDRYLNNKKYEIKSAHFNKEDDIKKPWVLVFKEKEDKDV